MLVCFWLRRSASGELALNGVHQQRADIGAKGVVDLANAGRAGHVDFGQMLADHGMAARGYKDVRANTVPSFALGDYEWILAFEAPELHRIVDLMRDLRATDARRHTREETPFFTGPRVSVEDLVAKLP